MQFRSVRIELFGYMYVTPVVACSGVVCIKPHVTHNLVTSSILQRRGKSPDGVNFVLNDGKWCYIKSLNLNLNLSITIFVIDKFEFRFKLLM